MHLNREQQTLTIRNRILGIGNQCVNKQPYDFKLQQGRYFRTLCPKSDEIIWENCSHEHFLSVWDPLTCWLLNNVLKRRFLESGLTKSLTLCNFSNTIAMTFFFCLKIFTIWCRFHNFNKKLRKSFSFLR